MYYEWHCSSCGTTSNQHQGTVFCDECINSRPRHLAWPRYLAALRRFRDSILNGAPLNGYDDNTMGSKNTEVTWGQCNQDKALWPDAQDHIWAYDFTSQGRSAPLPHDKGQVCPFDANRDTEGQDPSGCFYRCAFFQTRKLRAPVPDKDTILARYDALIATAEARVTRGETPLRPSTRSA